MRRSRERIIDDGLPLGTEDAEQVATAGEAATTTVYERVRSSITLRRDSDAMGLTAAVVLLAALSAGNDFEPHSKLDVLVVVWSATIGLAAVHWFAMLVAARLVSDPEERYSPLELLISQTVMAVVVATTATVFVVVLPGRLDRLGARLAAALFIGLLTAFETRRSGMSAARRVLLCGGLTVAGFAVATAKWYLS